MEATKTIAVQGSTARKGWAVGLVLVGVAVALAAVLVIPRTEGTTAHDRVSVAPAPVTLSLSATSLKSIAKHQELLHALARLQLPERTAQTSPVCLPCIERQHLSQVMRRPPA